MGQDMMFCMALFSIFIVFSIFFIAMMYTYKYNRLHNDGSSIHYYYASEPGKDSNTMIMTTEYICLWLSLPIITYLFFFKFLKNKALLQ